MAPNLCCMWHRTVRIALVASLASSAFSQTQMNLPASLSFTPVVVSAVPAFLPGTATSDPVAIKALQSLIKASGGMEAWRQVHSSKVRLTITTQASTKSHEVLMLDDWTSDSTRYRRGAIGGRRPPHDHNGQSTFNAADNGKDRALPEFDQARVLAGNLPAAAAEIILRKSSYVAKLAPGPRCSGSMICVDIYRQPSPKGLFVREQEWLISKASGLPTAVDLLLPNLNGVRPIWEEFKFSQMTSQNGLVIPTKIEMQHPSGVTLIRNVTSFTPNVPFDTAAFDKEIGR